MADTKVGSPASASARGPWLVLGMLGLVYLVNFLDRQIFAVLQEEIRAALDLADWQLGLLGGTMFAIFYATLGLPLAWIADRTNRVRVIAAACATWSVFTALSGAATTFVHMALARIGVASGEAGGVAPSYSVISDYFPPHRRALAIGVFSVGGPLGLMAGSLLGALIADALGWRWAFVLLGLPGLALAALLLVVVREPERGAMDVDTGPTTPSAALDAAKLIAGSPSLILFTAAAAFISFAGYGLYQWVPSFLIRTQGMALDQVGTLFAPIFLTGIIGSIAGGWLASRFGARNSAAYGLVPAAAMLIAGPFLIAALMAPSAGASVLFLIVPTMLSYVWIGPTLAASQNLSNPATRASVVAIMGFFNNLIGFGLGPLFVGSASSMLTPSLGSAEALRVSLIIGSATYFIGAALFVAAGWAMRREAGARLVA
ncbi:MFS transporter [Marinicauda salina]|uniref:MFS transporter n=1 Tax=Marinicauda salina TaxID=2135793 RepID=A0A2U2BU17_9PROT|nr:MFS transporter [Marinicauda salina]PWE17511.1 MFS transporter [Marinicauda salina]